ncbi:hypothetical protein FBU59_006217 [Linderina macrospora]|uniref:Uncharacterized protein n=1 Tax=Linderina macrospora TaxID=4868 RepID=A0ACC1J0T9_9FUNG|nr:hypothetical protein FBU59_006217 [Linderina macrospora]
MIAKLVVRGEDRQAALRVLRKALGEYEVVGLHTNIEFLKRLCESPDFIDGKVETGFINKHLEELFPKTNGPSTQAIAQAALASIVDTNLQYNGSSDSSPWAAGDLFRVNLQGSQSVRLVADGQEFDVAATVTGANAYAVQIKNASGETIAEFADVQPAWVPQPSGGQLQVVLDSRRCSSNVVFNSKDSSVTVFDYGKTATFTVPRPQFLDSAAEAGPGSVTAPMSCKIVQVLVEPGTEVAQDTPLVVLEAMKMEHVIKAPKAGKVVDVYYKVGDLVDEGKNLVAFEES